MKIAIASTDGQKVDCHFGKADKFFVYEIEDGLALSEGARMVTPYSAAPGHLFDDSKISVAINALEDCNLLYVARIGDIPKAKLEESGVHVIVSGLYVHELLKNHIGEES